MPPVVAAAGAAIGGAIGGSILGISAATIGSIAAQIGVGLVLSGIARSRIEDAISGGVGGGIQTRQVTVTSRSPAAPREIVYGFVRKGGTIIYADTNDDGKYLDVVIVLAAHEVEEIGAVYFDGVKGVEADGVTLTGNMFSEDGNPTVQVQKRTGYPGQPAFTILGSSRWTGDHTLDGCAAIAVRMRDYNGEFPNGLPNITVDVTGKNDVLDPRTGQRGWTDNAALCLADYMSLERFGLNATIGEDIDEDILIASANVCDEAVSLRQGGTEPRYTCNGVIKLDAPPRRIIEDILSAMAGDAVAQAGVWRIYAGAYRTPAVTLTEDDAAPGGIAVKTRVSAAENINGVKGLHISPDADWQPAAFPTYISGFYRTMDSGFERLRELELPFTTSPSTAQRIARIVLEKTRRQQTVEWTGKLSCWRAAAGETVYVDRPRWGWHQKPFDVDAARLVFEGGELRVRLTLRETSPLVYDWDATKQEIMEAAPRTNLPSRHDITPPGTPNATEELYATRNSAGVKARLNISWSPSTSGYVDHYRLEARRALDENASPTGDEFFSVGTYVGTAAVLPDVDPGQWELRVKAVSVLGVPSTWATASVPVDALGARPAALANVRAQSSGGLAVLSWNEIEDLDVLLGGRVVVRHSTDAAPAWSNSRFLKSVPGASGIAVVPLIPGAYLLRARDSSGNLGPVATVDNDAETALTFSNLASIQSDPTFPTFKTNAEVSGSALILTDPTSPGAIYMGEIDLGSVKPVRLRGEVNFTGTSLNSQFFGGAEKIFQGSGPVFGDEVFGADVQFEARLTKDDPSGTPTWTPWFQFDNHEAEARGVRFQARFRADDPETNISITRLRAYVCEVA